MTVDCDGISRRAEFLRDLAASAAQLAAEGFARQLGQPAGLKGPQDFLTETDGLVEDHIRARILAAFPEDGFLGEETGGHPVGPSWVVDPIDGTANFARAIPHFCVSIAFVADDRVQLGAIVNPALDESYFARLGHGAWKNGTRLAVSDTVDISATSFEMGWSQRRTTAEYIAAVTALIEAGANVRRGACGALGLAYVADGRSDGYAELHMNAWDCLAGMLLVREAGGVTGPFLSQGGLLEGGAVLAATPAVAGVLSRATGIALSPDHGIAPEAQSQILRTARA